MDKRKREITGSFYTPQIWVELSQKYLADVLGEDWQDEYYVWDCAAGTGNLLNGLTNKYNIWASTLDKQDVDVMKDRIKNGANLLEDHVFQFDFLNDDFSKLPKPLFEIVNNPEKRKKLVIYINPPYAEAGSSFVVGKRKNKTSVATQSVIYDKYKNKLGLAIRELYAQFFIRITQELHDCKLGSFSTLKEIVGEGFNSFRELFNPEFKKGFVVPANSFDNVNGIFAIGFLIWNMNNKTKFTKINIDVYDKNGKYIDNKNFYYIPKKERITDWIKKYVIKNKLNIIGYTGNNGPDFQNNSYCYLTNQYKTNKNGTPNNATKYSITEINLIELCIYFAVRKCIADTWLNNRDQFLFPSDGWQTDREFQNDCLTYALFHNKNLISSKHGINHWIPFTEYEVNSREKFESDFMTIFIKGKLKFSENGNLLEQEKVRTTELEFSPQAKAVFEAGRELWKYYHTQPNCNVNASLYDIKEYFQQRTENGRMNSKSKDENYTKLIADLRYKLDILAQKIEPKVYEYEFLKR